MGNEPSRIKALKTLALSRQMPKPEVMEKHYRELLKSPARTTVLLGATLLDITLEVVIKRAMIPLTRTDQEELFGSDRPLASFSAKIKIGHALGIVDKDARRNLEYVRAVRNVFAHTAQPIGFSTPEVRSVIQLLEPGNEWRKQAKASPRVQFLATCARLGRQISEYKLKKK